MNNSTGADYLFECFRTAREELLLRVKHRDNWLKTQLLAQGVLLALSQGVEVGGVKAGQPYPDVLALSISISFVLATCYYVEDSLIGFLSKYLGAISKAESMLRQGEWQILNWDVSEQLRQYARQILPTRFIAQSIAFMLIPAGLTMFRIVRFTSWEVLQWIELVVDIALLIMTSFVSIRAYRLRRTTGRMPAAPVLNSSNDIIQELLLGDNQKTTAKRD